MNERPLATSLAEQILSSEDAVIRTFAPLAREYLKEIEGVGKPAAGLCQMAAERAALWTRARGRLAQKFGEANDSEDAMHLEWLTGYWAKVGTERQQLHRQFREKLGAYHDLTGRESGT